MAVLGCVVFCACFARSGLLLEMFFGIIVRAIDNVSEFVASISFALLTRADAPFKEFHFEMLIEFNLTKTTK